MPVPATPQPTPEGSERVEIRPIRAGDRAAIVAIDAIHSGAAKDDYWRDTLRRVLRSGTESTGSVGFVAVIDGEVTGYVLAEARAWEFGSPLCGWITAIGVHPTNARHGVAFELERNICSWLRSRGIRSLRTMVRRDAVDVLSFFRASGFRAGPYLELELDL